MIKRDDNIELLRWLANRVIRREGISTKNVVSWVIYDDHEMVRNLFYSRSIFAFRTLNPMTLSFYDIQALILYIVLFVFYFTTIISYDLLFVKGNSLLRNVNYTSKFGL